MKFKSNFRGPRLILASISLALFLLSVSPAQASGKISIDESSNGKTIKVGFGQALSITLHSTYWTGSSVFHLKAIGVPVITPIMPGPGAPANCQHPGMGCGGVVWKFVAGVRGISSFTAIRDSCGEALQCSPQQKKFKVLFKVS